MDNPKITRQEWRNVTLFAVLVMLITTLPYLAGAAAQTSDLRFGWFLFGTEDGNSYLAKMREGAVDGWLFHIAYTSEPHDGAFLFTPYLAAGKLAALVVPPTSDQFVDVLIVVFHTTRILFGILLILVIYRFIAAFIVKRSLRWLALVLATLGGGFGWLLIILGQSNLLGSLPIDVILPEGYTFYLLYGLPHLELARAAMLGGFLLTFHAMAINAPWPAPTKNMDKRRLRAAMWMVLAGLCWLIMGLCVPFYIAVLYLILGAWGLAAWLRHRRFPAALFINAVIGSIIPAPLLLYSVYLLYANQVIGTWQRQNILPSPNPVHYLFGYGLLAILALPGIRWAWHKKNIPYLLPVGWLVAGPIMAYLPVAVQRRLLEGIFIPLCVMAVMGLRFWWTGLIVRRWPRRSAIRQFFQWRVVTICLLALILPTTLFLLIEGGFAARARAAVLFHSSAEIRMLDWLKDHAPDDAVVLSNFNIGNYLPVRTNDRAFIGHGPETLFLDTKQKLVDDFFAGKMTESAQEALFHLYTIRYVILSPAEPVTPHADLHLLYNQDNYRIYEVIYGAPF